MTYLVDILIVDDERVNLVMLGGILKGPSLNIVSANSGEEALELVRKHDFALVLLDVMMPGLDGFETAEIIRTLDNHRNVPIIFITAISKEQKHVFKGYELGAVDYLFKPVEPEILKSKVNVFIDLFRQKKALRESEERYRTVADYNWDWEIWFAPDGQVLYMSPSCERISGYPVQVYLDSPQKLEEIIHADDLTGWKGFMGDEFRAKGDSYDFRICHAQGDILWISQVNQEVRSLDGSGLGLRCSLRDITVRKKMELELRYQALHDPLTQMANRTLLLDRISQALQRSKRHDTCYAVIFMDLDRFKVLNDSLGHNFGDLLLIEVSKRLLSCVRSKDTVSRFGGDEFVLFLEDLDSPGEAFRVVRRVRDAMREPFVIGDQEVQTSASLGVVFDSEEHQSPDEIIQKANIAMYRAKEAGRDQYHVFDAHMLEQAVRLLKLENDLRRAITHQEFYVVYQPIMDLSNNKLTGFEALARWNRPDGEFIGPGEFIPVAEDTGMIIDIGMIILEQACVAMCSWLNEFPMAKHITVSVNLSGRQFGQESLTEDICQMLKKTGLPSGNLKLEITETTIMDDVHSSAFKLEELKLKGITLAIDDFGTGYSSLSYLQKLPLDHLKVDLSFVQQMQSSPANIEIVRAIINLAHSLRLKCVAEGIETVEQQSLLYSMQCEYGQGYLFAKPLPVTDVPTFIKQYT